MVHGEEESKKDFGKLIHDKLGYEPVVVLGNSEFELDMNTAQILNYEQAEQEAVEDEEIQAVRRKISDIHSGIESILYNTDLAMGRNISQEKLVKINNIVQELAKATMVLGSAVTEEDRSREEPVVDPK